MLDSLTRIELEKAKKGYYPGGGSNVPIGYKASKSYGKHKVHTRYLFEPTEQSRHIAEAYRRYKEGSTTGEIREYLNESGRANMAIINSSDLKTLEAVDEIISIAKSIGNMYDSFGEKSKRKLLLLLIKRILVNKKRGIVEIEFDFPLTKTSNGGLPPTILDTRSLVNELITFTIHNYHTIQSL